MIHDFSKVFDTDNPEWLKVLEIFERNEQYPKKRVRGRAFHHKFPKSCSKLLNEAEDNDTDNMISLSFSDHFMVHYYYYRLAKEGFKSRMALAFKLMADNFEGSITVLTPELAESISIEHQNATELANQFSSENGKGKIITEEQRKQISETLKGHTISEETRRKISETKRTNGYVITEETRAKLKTARARQVRGPLTEEWKQKIAKSKTGQTASEETRKKMSESQKGKHSGPKRPLTDAEKQHLSEVLKGRKLSEETRKKISESSKGKIISSEQREKISKTLKGRKQNPEVIRKIQETKQKNGTNKFSEEHKRKLSESLKGRKLSEETKAKMRKPKSDACKQKLSEYMKGRKIKVIDGKRVWVKEDVINNVVEENNERNN